MDSENALRSNLRFVSAILDKHKDVTEVMANADGTVWIEAGGRVKRVSSGIGADLRLSVIRLLAGYYNLTVTRDNPSLGVKVPLSEWSGGRFQGHIPPVVDGPAFSIRFPPKQVFGLDDLEERQTISPHDRDTIEHAVVNKRNMLIAGGTGSGKTTIATAALQLVTEERVVLIEDNPEIQLATKNRYEMLTNEGFSLRQAVQDSLRLRPDRIIVGEIRDGGTAVELSKAWMTGHPGGIGTIHASSADGVYQRLYTLMQEEVLTPSWDLVDNTADVVVFVKKVPTSDGTIQRKVTAVLDGEERRRLKKGA